MTPLPQATAEAVSFYGSPVTNASQPTPTEDKTSYRPKSPEAEVILDANKLTEMGCGEAGTTSS
jgi:hypothetical protein